MSCGTQAGEPKLELPGAGPWGKLKVYLIEQYYEQAGCGRWTTRRVRELCTKLGDTPETMAARLRISHAKFLDRLEASRWSKQDCLILTMLERDADFLLGGMAPKQPIFAPANPPTQ